MMNYEKELVPYMRVNIVYIHALIQQLTNCFISILRVLNISL